MQKVDRQPYPIGRFDARRARSAQGTLQCRKLLNAALQVSLMQHQASQSALAFPLAPTVNYQSDGEVIGHFDGN